MIRLEKLKEHFKLFSIDNWKTIILYSLKEHGEYNVNKYVCHITKVKKGWYKTPDNTPTNDLDSILKDINKYYSSLKYKSEFYNPLYREGYFELMVITDYLRNLGFDSGGNGFYSLKRENVYRGKRESVSLTIRGLELQFGDTKIPEKVSIILWLEKYSWVETECVSRNPDEIIKAIEGLLKPLMLFDSIQDFKKSEQFPAQNVEIMMNQLVDLSAQQGSYKKQLIKSLEKTLETLKA